MAGIQKKTLADRLAEIKAGKSPAKEEGKPAPKPKRGSAIFEHAGGPRTWDEYVGQPKAKGQLRAAVASAKFRKAPLDHVLIASGVPGVGKSALARLVAAEMGVGFIETQGAVTQDEAQAILSGMKAGDVWLIDEIHQLVVGGKSKAEWLLPLLQDGVLLSASGEWEAPRITIIGASTNAAELPEAILSRFVIRPVIDAYSDEDASRIARGMSQEIFDEIGLPAVSDGTCLAVARASNNSPRDMRALLALLRDAEIAEMSTRDEAGDSDLTVVLDWAGRTHDGLGDMAQKILVTLLTIFGGKAGKENLMNVLGESTYPHLDESLLMQKGYLMVDKTGRWLTEDGVARTMELEMT